jgi:hypothetical protein
MDDNDNTEESTGANDVQGTSEDNSSNENRTLTISQKARVERNRQAALLLKRSRLIPHPYSKM